MAYKYLKATDKYEGSGNYADQDIFRILPEGGLVKFQGVKTPTSDDPDDAVATKKYVLDNSGAGGFVWGDGTGDIEDQTDLIGLFDLKADLVAGKVPAAQLPSYVDDVLEFANLAAFPVTGEVDKIYIAIDTNLTYRWTGSVYAVLDPSLALGETISTAYRGDRGKTAFDHSQLTSGNPHNVTKTDVGLGNVDNTSDADKPVSSDTQTALDFKAPKENPTFTTGITTPLVSTDSIKALSGNAISIINAAGTDGANLNLNFASGIKEYKFSPVDGDVLIGSLETGTFTPDVTKAISIVLSDGTPLKLQVVT